MSYSYVGQEWVRTEEMRCKEALMNNDSGGRLEALLEVAGFAQSSVCAGSISRIAKLPNDM